jgi:hypothetical protein
MLAADQPAKTNTERRGKRSQNAFVGRSARFDATNRPCEYARLAYTVAACDPKPARSLAICLEAERRASRQNALTGLGLDQSA